LNDGNSESEDALFDYRLIICKFKNPMLYSNYQTKKP
jgi:hypothetical protein